MHLYGRFKPALASDIEIIERKYNVILPESYKKFIVKNGSGTYCSYIRVKSPELITEERESFNWFMNNIYYRDEYKDILTLTELLKSVEIADSIDGHKIVANNNAVYILPKFGDRILYMESGFEKPMRWTDGKKIVLEDPLNPYYLSNTNTATMSYPGIGKTYDEVLKSIRVLVPDCITFDECNDLDATVLFSELIGGRIVISTVCENTKMAEDIDVYFDSDSANLISLLFETIRDL